MNTKEKILSAVSEMEIFEEYARPFGYTKPGKPFSDPKVLPRKQKTPSMYIVDKGSSPYFKEFSSGDGGDCFAFVMRVMNCDFKTALEHIARDFILIL